MSKPTDVPGDRLARSLNSELHDYMVYSRHPQMTAKDYITINDLERICRYLKDPTSCGLWLFKGVWHGAQGITNEITEELKNLEKNQSTDIFRLQHFEQTGSICFSTEHHEATTFGSPSKGKQTTLKRKTNKNFHRNRSVG